MKLENNSSAKVIEFHKKHSHKITHLSPPTIRLHFSSSLMFHNSIPDLFPQLLSTTLNLAGLEVEGASQQHEAHGPRPNA